MNRNANAGAAGKSDVVEEPGRSGGNARKDDRVASVEEFRALIEKANDAIFAVEKACGPVGDRQRRIFYSVRCNLGAAGANALEEFSRKARIRGVLVAARAIIETPDRFARGCLAEDAAGAQVASWDATAVRWSLSGALALASGRTGVTDTYVRRAVRAAIGSPPCTEDYGIDSWESEPGRTHAEVLAILDKAITECGE